MGKSQRVKGAVFEREIAEIFSQYFGKTFKRNIGQARDGGNDLDVGPLVVEMKRRASLKTLRSWLAQAEAAANARLTAAHEKVATAADSHYDHIPIVVARADGDGESMVLLGMEDFLYLVGPKVMEKLDAA